MKTNEWVDGKRTEVHFFDDTQYVRTETYTDLGTMYSTDEHITDKKEYFKRKLKGK